MRVIGKGLPRETFKSEIMLCNMINLIEAIVE